MKLQERPRGLFDDVLGLVARPYGGGGRWRGWGRAAGAPSVFVMVRRQPGGGLFSGRPLATRNMIERICTDGSYQIAPRRKAKAT